MKLKFKTEREAGRWGWLHDPKHYILLDGQRVGQINHSSNKIRLMVEKSDINEDGNPNCPWKWVQLAKDFNSLDEAKKFLESKIDIICTKYNLHRLPKT